MKKIAGILLLCGLCLEACPQLSVAPLNDGGHLRVSAKLAEGQPVKIVCFGDSITGVYYHTGGRRSWCDLLGIALTRIFPQAQIEMINAGVSGHDTDAGLKRMETDVLRHAPDLVVIMFGMNDVRSLMPVGFRNNLRTMVRRSRESGAEVMLMTPNAIGPGDPVRPPARLDDYVKSVREVGRELELPVVDTHAIFAAIMAADPAAWQRLMSDTIHPNLRGHRIFAEAVARAITGRQVSLTDLPMLHPGLPCVLARLNARQPVRVVAMPPYDALIAPGMLQVASPLSESLDDYFAGSEAEMDFVLFSNYGRQVEALLAGHIDIAWNTNLAWVRTVLQTDGQCRALAMRDTDRTFASVLVTRAGTGFSGPLDLKGKRLAVGSKDSTQATILPLYYLRREGLEDTDVEVLRLDRDPGKHGDTGRSELDAIRAVLDGDADAAAIGNVTWDAIGRGELMPGALEAFWRSPEFYHCNFTALSALPEERSRPWVDTLLAMDWAVPEQRRILELEGLRHWLPGDTSGYATLFDAVKEQSIASAW